MIGLSVLETRNLGVWKEHRSIGNREVLIKILFLTLFNCVVTGNFLNFSESQFGPMLKNVIILAW